MTEEDRKVVSDKITKHGLDSLSEEDMKLLPSMGVKFSFSELTKLVEVLNQAKTAPWLSDVQMVFVTDIVRDLNSSMDEAVRKLSEYVKSRKHYEDNFEKDKPDPKKEYMEKISGNVGIGTDSVYVDGINVGKKKKAPVVLEGRFAEEEKPPKVRQEKWKVIEQMYKEYPETMEAFEEIQDAEFSLFASKQSDYGPGNIGMNGNLSLSLLALGVRMNDKVQRILHILNKQRNSRKNVWETNNEPLEDSFKDISVYGVIGQIVMDDKWGK